jgi:hypothetical protein
LRNVGGDVVPAVVGPDGIVPPEVVVCVSAAATAGVVGAAGVVVLVVVVDVVGVAAPPDVPPVVVVVVVDAGFAPAVVVCFVEDVPDRFATNVDGLCKVGVSTGEDPVFGATDRAAAAIAVSGPLVHAPVGAPVAPDAECNEEPFELEFELEAIGEM